MIKLIVIDLDGTLLNDNKKISSSNENAIAKALEMGVYVSISTGRSYVSGHEIVEKLAIDIPVSYQNGALIVHGCGRDLRIISQSFLSANRAVAIYKKAIEKSLNSLVFFDFFRVPDISIATLTDSPYRRYYLNNSYRIIRDEDPLSRIEDQGIPEVAIEGKESIILEALGDLNSQLEGVTVVKNDNQEDHAFYEFFGPGVGKSNGLRHILDYLDLEWEEVAYIGDNFNDIDILRRAALPSVMSNAPDEVKRYAKIVTRNSNNDNGVAEAIESIMNWQEC